VEDESARKTSYARLEDASPLCGTVTVQKALDILSRPKKTRKRGGWNRQLSVLDKVIVSCTGVNRRRKKAEEEISFACVVRPKKPTEQTGKLNDEFRYRSGLNNHGGGHTPGRIPANVSQEGERVRATQNTSRTWDQKKATRSYALRRNRPKRKAGQVSKSRPESAREQLSRTAGSSAEREI